MAHAVFLVHIDVDPAVEQPWTAYMFEQHVPEVVKLGGFLRARHFVSAERAPDGWTRFVVIYEAESRAALDGYLNGPHVARLRAEFIERWGKHARVQRHILVERGEPIRP